MQRCLITGTGMVGSALAQLADDAGWPVKVLGHADLDITDPQAVSAAVKQARPDIVFHTAAMTKVNQCQEDPAAAARVNTQGTANVVRAAEDAGARLVYFSTDYVFDGEKGEPYTEEDEPNPVNEYGWSKLLGEAHLMSYDLGHIVRTSGVFGPRADGAERNFMRAIHDAIIGGKREIEVVNDQFTAVTYSLHLAAMVLHLLEQGLPKTVHLTGEGEGSWYDWAVQVASCMDTGTVQIKPVPSKSRDTGTPRPMYSVLKSGYPAVRQLVSEYASGEAIAEYVRFLGAR